MRCLVASTLLLAALAASTGGCGAEGDQGSPAATAPGGPADGSSGTTDAAGPPAGTPVPLPARSVGPLEIEPGAVNFGRVEPRSTHRAEFVLSNVGIAPLTIAGVKSTCACTATQDIVGRAIAPGEVLPFSSTFRAPTQLGPRDAQVTIIFEYSGRQVPARLTIEGVVVAKIRAEPPYVDALRQATAGEIRLDAGDGRGFRVVSAGGAPPVHADGFDPAGPPRSGYVLRWSVEPRSSGDCEGAPLWWVIETDHPDCPVLPLYIRHECTGGQRDPERQRRGWYFHEYVASFGAVRAGRSAETEVEIAHTAARVPISGVRSLSPDARAELLSAEAGPGDSTVCRVRFTPRAGYQGLLYAMVEFQSPTGAKDIAFIASVR